MTQVKKSTKVANNNESVVELVVTSEILVGMLQESSMDFQEFSTYYQALSQEQKGNMPLLSLKNNVISISKKGTRSGTLKISDMQANILSILDKAEAPLNKQEICIGLDLDYAENHRDVLQKIKSLKNENRPDSERVIMNISVVGGKVIYTYLVASKCETFGIPNNNISDL